MVIIVFSSNDPGWAVLMQLFAKKNFPNRKIHILGNAGVVTDCEASFRPIRMFVRFDRFYWEFWAGFDDSFCRQP